MPRCSLYFLKNDDWIIAQNKRTTDRQLNDLQQMQHFLDKAAIIPFVKLMILFV